MQVATLLLLGALSGQLPPKPPCTPIVGDHAKTAMWLRGTYRVIGYRAADQTTYLGALEATGDENASMLSLRRTISGTTSIGTARFVECGADAVRQMEVQFGDERDEETLYCVRHNDYDNVDRMTCARSLSDPSGDIEVWYRQAGT